MNNSPIGVFDSGMGGLSVWRELRAGLPNESLIYFGDGKNCPYGNKPQEEVYLYIEDAVSQLLNKGAKIIVLACNTATLVAIRRLRTKYDVPFVGMEPAIKPAASSTGSGVIGVLATGNALGSEWFADLKSKYSDGTVILTAEGEGFVDAVEAGREDSDESYLLAERAVKPMLDAGADRIVLGCTHYPFFTNQIKKVIGSRKVEIIDPAPAILRRVEWLLDNNNLKAGTDHIPEYEFMTSSSREYLQKLISRAQNCIGG